MLVKSSVQPVTTPQFDNPGCFKCHRKVCDACQNFLLPYRHIISVATGKSYKIRQHLSCQTDFVIYSAFCKKCNRQCGGSAIDFRYRLSNYKSHIKKQKRTCRLVNHFIDNSSDHPLDCLKFTLIEQVSNKIKIWRNKRATGKRNSAPSSLLVLMPKKNLIQTGDISS